MGSEVTQRMQMLKTKPDDLSSIPEPMCWGERMDSFKLSSDLYLCIIHTCVCVCNPCVPGVLKDSKRELDSLELE